MSDKETNKVIKLGNVYYNPKNIGGSGRGAIYDINGISATILTMSGGGNKPFVLIKTRTVRTK